MQRIIAVIPFSIFDLQHRNSIIHKNIYYRHCCITYMLKRKDWIPFIFLMMPNNLPIKH